MAASITDNQIEGRAGLDAVSIDYSIPQALPDNFYMLAHLVLTAANLSGIAIPFHTRGNSD